MINWSYVAKAIEFYQENGFKYLEVPWIVPEQAVAVTLPKDKKSLDTRLGTLVGSAEQSFIYLMQGNWLFNARHVAATPCFRDDPEDDLHHKWFFKVELIERVAPYLKQTAIEDVVWNMATVALDFYQSLPGGAAAAIVPTPDGLDIELHGRELGSYGHRSYESVNGFVSTRFAWVYGTGFADPRFSYASDRKMG